MKEYMQTRYTLPAKLGAILIVAALVLGACSGGGTKATKVEITAPAPGTIINVGQGTVIQGNASGESITRVEVVIDGKAYASLSTPDKTKGVSDFPVSVPWTPMSAGTHAIQLRAFGLEDKLLGQSEPLVMDAKAAAVAQVTPTTAATKPVATAAAAPTSSQAGTTPQATQAQATQGTTGGDGPSLKVTSDVGYVNVREGPNIGYKLLGTLDNGQTATVRGKSQDGQWWQISYAAGSNGVGWVNGEYVEANAAANSVPVASAPPLPTRAPVPTSPPAPVATLPPPTAPAAPAPTQVVSSLPTTGSQGKLRVNKNPIQANETVYASWDVQNISAIWFDKGDGTGYLAAGGTQSNVPVSGITSARTIRLKWRDNNSVEHVDELTIGIVGQVAAATSTPVSAACNSSNPDWRGGSSDYPFCVSKDMDWADGGSPVRYLSANTDINIGVSWNVYGIAGIWVVIEGNGNQCGPAGSSSRTVAVSGSGSYYWNVNDFETGGYKVSLKILRNDGVEVRHNEKYMCVGISATSPTSMPTQPAASATPPVTEIPLPATAAP
ncbi:MAG: SH3 domain-containing protein [Chloroflexi bacterium]|nr:SH3 domain-containing protein [Chloroflexota bacterium]